MSWSKFEGSDAEWDELALRLGSSSPFNSSAWGRHKGTSHWSTTKCIYRINEQVVSAAQIFVTKRIRIFAIGWIPGGIIGSSVVSADELISFIKSISQSPIAYCRIAIHRPHAENLTFDLSKRGWHHAHSFIGSRETFVIRQIEGRLAHKRSLSSNWARNLERGLKRDNNSSIWSQPNPREIHLIMSQMAEFKKAKGPSHIASVQELENLLREMRDDLIVIQTRNSDGSLLAIRAAFIIGGHAWDALAAATPDGRKNYSSYVCFWKLLETLDDQGVNQFDLAGIDQENNEGVFNFKKGLGGARETYVGEWDVATPSVIRHIVGKAISRLA